MKTKNLLGIVLILAVAFSLASCANQNKKLALRTIHFDFDKSFIRSDMIPIMDTNVRYLQRSKRHFATKAIRGGHLKNSVTIEGHCDERGTTEYNYALGARRSESSKSYLVTHGVDPARVKTVSFGEDRPVCTKHDESCWYTNRRTDFRLGD
ncbi:MAG: OmpA family protein [Deltaproteobacteria bacterium]|nr:OmpA family protein [Deltaproteobacteria bacterium]